MEEQRTMVMFYEDKLKKMDKKTSIFNHPTTLKWGIGWDDEHFPYHSPEIFDVKTFLSIEQNSIDVLDEHFAMIQVLKYTEIEKVSISMCSRKGTYNTFGNKTKYSFQIDLDIQTKTKIFKFEVFEPKSLMAFVNCWNQHSILIEDPMNVIGLFREIPDFVDRLRYLQYHFDSMAKEYHLDHPRI